MQVISNHKLIEKSKWSDFVRNHPNGNVFQTPEMFNVYANTKNFSPVFIAVLDKNKKIAATLLGVIQKESKGIIGALTARSVVSGGPLVKNNDKESMELILKSYNEIVKRKTIYSQFRNFYNTTSFTDIYKKYGYIFTDHLNILVNLNIGTDALWNQFSKSRKKGIKKAISNKLTFDISHNLESLDLFYELLTLTYKRIKLPAPDRTHFIELGNNLKEDKYYIFTMEKNGKVLIAIFVLIHKETIYGYYMGSVNDNEMLKLRPFDLLFWEIFKWSIDNNLKVFDWMGAGKPNNNYGVRDFKKQYGGDLINYGRYEKIHNPFIYNLAKLGLNLWRKI